MATKQSTITGPGEAPSAIGYDSLTMPTERSLANLCPPVRRGERGRNPKGRNQYTADRELRQEYRAICRAIDEAPGPVADAIYEQLLNALAARLMERGRGVDRLVLAFLDREWPLPDPTQYARVCENSQRRVVSWARR